MRTPKSALLRFAALLAIAAQGSFLTPLRAQNSLVPVVSIRAAVAETREPFCDPAVCDAALPAPGVFVVTRRDGDLSRELSVSMSYAGTATGGTDYPARPSSVFFRAGEASVEMVVQAAYDRRSEGDETVVAQVLPDPTMGPIERYRVDPAQSAARVVIHDNEAPVEPVVSIEATSPIAEESSFPYRRLALRGRFTISRTGSTEHGLPVFVHYGGTATRGVDYPILPWLVTIPAGTDRIEIEVLPNPDDRPEPIETLEATLSQCPPLTDPPLGLPCHLVNINPAHASALVFIRDDGITTASLEITAPRDGAEFREGTPIPITATAIDLEGAITHVDFFDGDQKIGESTIVFIRQPDPGTPIDHEFEWRGALAGLHSLTARALDAAGNAVTSAPVRVRVGDGLPVVSIHATQPYTAEPCPVCFVAPGVFTISRTGPTVSPLVVFLAAHGTATPGDDYLPLPPTVEIPAGREWVQLLALPMDDLLVEGDETVIAELQPDPSSGPIERYRIDPEQRGATVIIRDDESPLVPLPVVTIVATDPFAREGANNTGLNTATFVVSRAGATSDPLEVLFNIGGTAGNGVDYSAIWSPLTIPAGRRTARIVVGPLEDNRPEPVETVVVTLLESDAGVRRYLLGRPHRAAAIIVDNDQPRPPRIRLPDGLFNVCVPMDPNHCFRVESTRDFKVWTPLCTLPVDEGMAHYVDPDAAAASHQFYRLVPVACEPEE